MDELVRALRHFVFLVGGGSVVASFVYTFGIPLTAKDHVILYLLAAGISYVVGYALQDIGGFTTGTYESHRGKTCPRQRTLSEPRKGSSTSARSHGSRVGLIEVKTTDRLHPSRIIAIPEMREVADLQMEVAQVRS